MSVTSKTTPTLVDKCKEMAHENTSLREQVRDLTHYAHILSHDLRAPLRNINNLAMLVRMDKESTLSTVATENIEKLQSQASNLHKLILDLREISRQNVNNLAMEEVSANDILKQVLQQYAQEIEEEKVDLEIGELPRIFANPQLLWQLFDNLIRNALKHGARPLKIRVFAERSPGETTICIVNSVETGREFNPMFFEFSNASGEHASTGIGLYICKKVVEIHNGKILAEQKEGEFHMIIKLKEFDSGRN